MDGTANFPHDNDVKVMETTEVRQAESGVGVRYVLAISTVAAFLLMSFIYYFFFAH
jgi:hypothetical protein